MLYNLEFTRFFQRIVLTGLHAILPDITRILASVLWFMCIYSSSYAQIETTVINEAAVMSPEKAVFFTNRPLVVNEDSSITFKNKFTDKSNTLYFCSYRYDTDSIEVYYKATNLSEKYPTGNLEYNFFYDVYKYHRLERGIKNFYTMQPAFLVKLFMNWPPNTTIWLLRSPSRMIPLNKSSLLNSCFNCLHWRFRI